MYQLDKLKNVKNLVHGFSDMKDGNMSFSWGARETVLRNRSNFLDKLGIKSEDCAVMLLSHGTNVGLIDELSRGKEQADADCLITKSKNVYLFVLTGDCLPVIMYDPVESVIALAHMSRMNTPEELAGKIVKKMKSEYGVKPENIIAGIGPCIDKESYVFSAEELRKRVPDERVFNGFIAGVPDGAKSIDLTGYNVREMISAGIKKENIEISGIDTAKDENFFSHYRSRQNEAPEGRMATVAGIRGIT